MPTVRHAKPRGHFAQLTEQQLAYLLDQDIPEPEGGAADEWLWWWIVEAHQGDRPSNAYYATSAASVWRQHRHELLGLWRQLHGRRKHPLDREPPELPQAAEVSAKALHARWLARQSRRVVPIREPAP